MRWFPWLSVLVSLLASPLQAAPPPELRGLWVGGGTFNTPETVADVVDRAAAAHLNALFPLVWYHGGQAWYQTPLCPLAADVAPDFDPLGTMIKLAHAKGLQVHAWFVNGTSGGGGKLLAEHPDWALQTARPVLTPWYDLGKPEVREFEKNVMLDCLRRYDVDGIHFDYIRYNSQEYCHCTHCQEEFSRRTGLPPLQAGGKAFPIAMPTSGNPLVGPTTAQVLATFQDGVPAITLNKLGQGEAALLNWQALRPATPAVDDVVQRLLQRFGATAANTVQLRTTATSAKYTVAYQDEARAWLQALGTKLKVIDETKLTAVPTGGTIFLYGQYYIPDEAAAWLQQFVTAGGHALFVDGPVYGIKSPALQAVIGMKEMGKYFKGMRVISPLPGQDFLTVGPPVDPAVEEQRLGKWVEYRKWTVTQLVRSVYQGARQIKPQAQVSAAVFNSRAAADLVCQDWYNWLKEGILDVAVTMAYVMDTAKLQEMLQEYKAADPQFERIIPGLSLYQKGDGGQASSRPRALVLEQVAACRASGARGTFFFASNYLNTDLITGLAEGPYAEPAQPYQPQARP